MYDQERKLREIQKCTFMPNHEKYQSVKGVKQINPYYIDDPSQNDPNFVEEKKQKSKQKSQMDLNISYKSDKKESVSYRVYRALSTANIRPGNQETTKKHKFKQN